MIKFGIHNLAQLRNRSDHKGLWGDPKNISIDLYPQVLDLPESAELAEDILFSFTDESRIYKRTYKNRFEKFDEEITKLAAGIFGSIPAVVYDLGVSDARTSIELYEALSRIGKEIQFYALDIDAELILVEEGKTKIVVNQNSRILQIIHPPFVFNLSNRDSYRLYPLNHLFRIPLQYFIARRMIRQNKNKKTITLFCTEAQSLASSDSRFHLQNRNILTPFADPGSVGVIRAMNLLSFANFSSEQLSIALRNMFHALVEGGILATGNNNEPATIIDGGLFRKNQGKFILIQRSGNGSPIEEVIGSFYEK